MSFWPTEVVDRTFPSHYLEGMTLDGCIVVLIIFIPF
jgi:hypothetical protein